MRIRRLLERHPAVFAALMLLGFVLCTAGSVMFRGALSNKAFWPANGFLVILYLAAPRRWEAMTTAIVGVLYLAVVYAIGHRPPVFAAMGAVTNIFESWLTARLCVRLLSRDPDFTDVKGLMTFAVGCVLPSVMIGGAAFDLVQFATIGHVRWIDFRNWVAEDGFGILMTTPAVWICLFPRDEGLFRTLASERLWALALLAAGVCALFLSSSLPALFLVFPILMFISFRHGSVGAARAVLITDFFAFGFTVAGQGPLAAMLNAGQDYVALLQQLFVVSATLTALPVAGAFAEQARLRRDLGEREAQALRAVAAKSDFLATMSHELRTPLHSIIAFSDMLASSPAIGGEEARRVSVIREASGSLLTVVDDILDYSKIEAGRVELAHNPFDLGQWLDATVPIVADLARSKGLRLEVNAGPEVRGWRLGDSARLRQVLLNLLNNAIKFTGEGGVSVEVCEVSREGAEDVVLFAVVDTGIGISPEAQAGLFQRFQQADGSISREFGGTGLGLAICKRLVELMDGRIGVESEPGKGSTFWFEVPLGQTEAPPQAPAAPERQAFAVKALLVDDLAPNREIGKLVLESIGCQAVTAGSAEEAIERLGAEAFDIVFMDVHMPGADGLEATRRIRASGQPWAKTPIVAMTANVLPEQVQACLDAGMVGHVGKPFRPEDLANAIVAVAMSDGFGEASGDDIAA